MKKKTGLESNKGNTSFGRLISQWFVQVCDSLFFLQIEARAARAMTTLFLFAILLYGVRGQEVEYDVQSWTQAAQYLLSAMDPTADTCNNFFGHVCGRYNSSSQGGEGEYQRALLDKQAGTIKVLEEAIAKVNLKKKKTPQYAQAIRNFYDHCSSQKAESKKMIAQLYEAVEDRLGPFPLFGPVPDKFSVWRTSGVMARQADTEMGIGGTVVLPAEVSQVITALNTTTNPVVVVGPAALTKNVDFSAARTKGLIISMANATGKKVEEAKVDELVSRIEALHTDMVNNPVVPSLGEGTVYTLSNLTAKYPFMDEYLDGLLEPSIRKRWSASVKPIVDVQNQEWLEAFATIAKNKTHKPDAWQAWAFLTVVQTFREQYFGEYDAEKAVIFDEPKTIKERCLDFVVRMMPAGAARLYLDNINEDAGRWRSEIQLMARNIFSAFRFMLNSIEWMDEGEKVKINEKIDAIKFDPGLPDWIGDDEKVAANMNVYNESQSLYENDLVHKTKVFDKNARQLVDGPNQEDPPPTFKLNSQYVPATKTVQVFLGFILPPYYQPTYPLAVKYGGFGMVLGHELGHAFDNEGVYDPASPNKPWLKKETLQEFEKRKACLIQQYSQYCYKSLGMCVNGEKTVGDNIADIDGLKAAYLAYKYVARTIGGDIPVPQLENYTSDQIFFMSAARQWCTRNDPTQFALILDEHTPDRARIETAVRNVPQFATAYKCPVGSAAVPTKACTLWGDFTGPNKPKKSKGEKGAAGKDGS